MDELRAPCADDAGRYGGGTVTQYCRYCVYLCTGNGIWCDKQGREIKEGTAKSPNRCHDFAFCPIDAFAENDRGYRPRVKRKKQCDGQMSLF